MSAKGASGQSKTADGEELQAHVNPRVIEALDAYAADESITRSEAIATILANWLRTHGYKITQTKKPSGPATDAVAAMDAAIAEHRKAKKR